MGGVPGRRLEELPAGGADLPRGPAIGAERAEGGGDHRRRRLLEEVSRGLSAVPGGAADGRGRAARDRGLQGIRYHLGDDARRAGQQHQVSQHRGLSGGVLVPARRQRRFDRSHRRPHQRRFYSSLRVGHAPAGGGAVMSRRRQRTIRSWLIYGAAILLTVMILAPLVWMGLMSVSSTNDLTTVPLRWIPAEWDFSRYIKLLTIAE